MGGYVDKKNTSSEITTHIIRLLSSISTERAPKMKMRLLTCIVTSLNDKAFLLGGDGSSSSSNRRSSRPIACGMSLNVRTGEAKPIRRVEKSLRGPVATLRHVRLYSSSPNTGDLLTVHTAEEEGLIISPFEFSPHQNIELMLSLSDEILLKCCSTSPECEDDDFCEQIRENCRFLRDVAVEDVFGKDRNDSIIYRWKAGEWNREDGRIGKNDTFQRSVY